MGQTKNLKLEFNEDPSVICQKALELARALSRDDLRQLADHLHEIARQRHHSCQKKTFTVDLERDQIYL